MCNEHKEFDKLIQITEKILCIPGKYKLSRIMNTFLISLLGIGLFCCNDRKPTNNDMPIEFDNLKPNNELQTQKLGLTPDHIAPDGSKIFKLPDMSRGGLSICELAPGQTTQAVKHKTVEEIWYFQSGEGEVWRKLNIHEEITKVNEDISITIPLGCEFQFKNTGKDPLRFIIVTMPPWPGPDEAVQVKGRW